MKKYLIIAFTLLLASCKTMEPQEAAEIIVKKFLTAIYNNDKQEIKDLLDSGIFWRSKEGDDKHVQIMQDYNPHWNPQDVIIERCETDEIETFIDVYANCDDQRALFIVHMEEGTFGDDYHMCDTKGFLNFDALTHRSDYDIIIKEEKVLNKRDFDYFHYRHIEYCEEVANVVKKLFNALRTHKDYRKLYPTSADFNNCLTVDSLSSLRIMRVKINKSQKEDSEYQFTVFCSDSLYFILQFKHDEKTDDYVPVIIDSKGFYDYNKHFVEICAERGYAITDELREYMNNSKTDMEAIEKIKGLDQEVEYEIRMAEARKRQAKIDDYFKQIGLRIYKLEMITGQNKDGDRTVGFRCEVNNPTNKTIKYVNLHLRPVNAVGDAMGYNRTFSGIGPIGPGDSGTFEDDNMFVDVNHVIDDLSATIDVQYTDGSRKNVKLRDAMKTDF